MPRLALSEPPRLGLGARYSAYKPWLLEHFFDHICAYCLLRDRGVQVEHYEPRKYAPEREHDPTNLLLACAACNGSGGKGDYHPNHRERRRRPHDTTGYEILDIRRDDFAEMLRLTGDGELEPRGSQRDRAAWNIALLKLDLISEERKRLLDLVGAADLALRAIDAGNDTPASEILKRITPPLVERVLMLEVLGFPLSERVRQHLRECGARLLQNR